MSDEEVRSLERVAKVGDDTAAIRLAAMGARLRTPFHELARETLVVGGSGAHCSDWGENRLTVATLQFLQRLVSDGELDMPPPWHFKINAYRDSTALSIRAVCPWDYASPYRHREVASIMAGLARVFGCRVPHYGLDGLEVECSASPHFKLFADPRAPLPTLIVRHAEILRAQLDPSAAKNGPARPSSPDASQIQ